MQNIWNKLGLTRKDWIAWSLYDWGQSAFTTTVMVGFLPIYFAEIAGVNLPEHLRTAYWGYISAVGLVLVALISPALGVLADMRASNKKMLAIFAFTGSAFSIALCLMQTGQWKLTSTIFLVAFVCYAASLVMYDSLLMQIATVEEADTVSSAGYAIGYLGGGVLFVINVIMASKPQWFGLADEWAAMRWSFVTVGIWWAAFTIPLLLYVHERPMPIGAVKPPLTFSLIKTVYVRIVHTFQDIRRYRQLFIFLCAYWLYSDGIGTIFRMSTVFGKEVGLANSTLMMAFIAVQFIGVPSTFFFGWLASKIGAKQSLYITLVVYCFVTILGYFMTEAWHFWALSILVGLVQGGSQALSRSLYTRLVPPAKASEFFGFYSLSERFAGVLGPLLFAIISQMTGHSRNSILFLIAFFIIGIWLLRKVDFEAGRAAALADPSS